MSNRMRAFTLAACCLLAQNPLRVFAQTAPGPVGTPPKGVTFGGATASAVYDSATPPTGTDLQVRRVVPEGTQVLSSVRQIVVTFDRPVTPLGNMAVQAAQSGVSLSPPLACQWHWLDPVSLACELNAAQALVPATQYTVNVAAGIKAQDG